MTIHRNTNRATTVLALLLACSGTSRVAGASQTKRPNILVFFTDDQRAGTIRALGNQQIHTPNLDRLVERGIAFRRAYMMGGMTGATCVPSRAMLHTGRHLFHLKANGSRLPEGTVTLGEAMRAGGYHTYFTGKRHALDRQALKRGFADGGVVMGFAGYYTDKRRMPIHDWDPNAAYKKERGYIHVGMNGERKRIGEIRNRNAALQLEPGPFATKLYIDPAVDFIKRYRNDNPFFLYVSLSAPHDPHEAPNDIRRKYDPEKMPLPPNFRTEHPFDNGELEVRDEKLAARPRDPAVIRQRIADYYAAITFIDRQFGRLIAALRESDRLENTIIVFMGDSGLAVGQHGLLGKQNLYDDAGVRVPWIMAGPGVPNNQRRDALVCTFDLYPTLCELAGTPLPPSVEGRSIVPLFTDPDARHRDHVYLAYREYQRAVVESRYKLIEYVRVAQKGKAAGTRMTQLFDLQEDPWETTNLASDAAHESTLQRLQRKLMQLRQEFDDGTAKGRTLYPQMHEKYRLFWENYR